MSYRESSKQTGQALLELVITLPLILICVAGTILLFWTEWNRTRCAYQVFRAAHMALRQPPGHPVRDSGDPEGTTSWFLQGLHPIRITRSENGVTAQARCGEAEEIVRLPDLEKARW